MPQIKEITVYTFAELSESAKKQAISNLSDINTDYEWWESTYDDAANIGLKIKGFDIDRGSYVKGEFIDYAEKCAEKILKEHGKDCETYKTAYEYSMTLAGIIEDTNDENENEKAEERAELNSEFLKSLCEDYRMILSHEYDYLTSEKAIIETIEANNYTFTESGKLENI